MPVGVAEDLIDYQGSKPEAKEIEGLLDKASSLLVAQRTDATSTRAILVVP